MAVSAFGSKLDPYRTFRTLTSLKDGERQLEVIPNKVTTVDQRQMVTIDFPQLKPDDVIVPGSARVAFDLALTNGSSGTADTARTIVNNISRAIITKIVVRMAGYDIYTLDNADLYFCYKDLWWMTDKERTNAAYRGIQNANTAKIRVGASGASATAQPDASIAAAYGNRFCIPLDIELLTEHMPFYQNGLNDRLSIDLYFAEYGKVVISANSTASFIISNISLEYEVVRCKDLADTIREVYTKGVSLLYTRVLCLEKRQLNKSDTLWNFSITQTARSLRGILFLFEDPSAGAMGPAYGRNSEYFYNPLITDVHVIVNGISNRLYSQGLKPYQHWDEITRGWMPEVLKRMELTSTDHTNYFQNRYALWIDCRTSDDNHLHGSGIKLSGNGNSIVLEMTKTAQTAGLIYCYTYLLLDAQMDIGNGRVTQVLFNA
jgi:hypothetical protein